MGFEEERGSAVLGMVGRWLNGVLSVIIFSIIEVVDLLLCYAYKVADFVMEAEWKNCYCSARPKILISEQKMVQVTKLQLDEISDTLYTRPSILRDVGLRLRLSKPKMITATHRRRSTTTFTVNSTLVRMLQAAHNPPQLPIPRWSDCHCKTCTSWITAPSQQSLFVKADGAIENAQEDVVFIHGFISSSAFWSETVYPNFSKGAKSKYRLLAVDLLGFGRSPKPGDSLYTLREHVEMIEKSVLEAYQVKSFHIVAHSLGCILALALANNHPHSLKSLTLLAPPYFPAPKGEKGRAGEYTMRRIAPRRVWPPMTFAASVGCWYEHIARTASLLLSKNHRLWEYLTKLLTRNRMRTFLIDCFFLHTHNAAWHTLHNIICGSASKMEGYLEEVKCAVMIYHGEDDELIPVECSYEMQSRIGGAQVKVVKNADHLTIVVGREKAFARELERIWNDAKY